MMGRIVKLGVSVMALAALAACSGGEEDADDATETPTATTPAANTSAAGTPAATTAVAYSSLTGDGAKGEKIFIQCKTCHVLDKGVNKVGPSLHDIIGRPAGQVAGFNYSAANKNSGITWTEDQIFEYLAAPQKKVPGTKMAFAGLPNPQDRADVIAYLKTASVVGD